MRGEHRRTDELTVSVPYRFVHHHAFCAFDSLALSATPTLALDGLVLTYLFTVE